jgi:hypothetical protein
MYGLESIFSNLLTTAAAPAVGGFFGDLAEQGIQDATESELLKTITGTTVGALGGAALGAGLGALTGGKEGAMGGALTGGAGGAFGGYNRADVMSSLGLGQDVQPSQGSDFGAMQQGAPADLGVNVTNKPLELPHSGMPAPTQKMSPMPAPTPPTAPTQPTGNYIDFLKKNYEVLAPMFFGGSTITSNAQQNALGQQYQQGNAIGDMLARRRAHNFAQSVYGMADGGPVETHPFNDPNITVRTPQWYVDDMARSGGIAALQPGLDHGYANGGYINTQPINPDAFYPQSQIAKARPYPAASPQRHEVLEFEHGGLIDGPGDGMSDDIPANISGKEPVKVADGEYVVPRDLAAHKEKQLKHMLSAVRSAAHAKKGKQIVQDAAKRAFIKSMTGVRA